MQVSLDHLDLILLGRPVVNVITRIQQSKLPSTKGLALPPPSPFSWSERTDPSPQWRMAEYDLDLSFAWEQLAADNIDSKRCLQ